MGMTNIFQRDKVISAHNLTPSSSTPSLYLPSLPPEESKCYRLPSLASHLERVREVGSTGHLPPVMPTTVWQVSGKGGRRIGINKINSTHFTQPGKAQANASPCTACQTTKHTSMLCPNRSAMQLFLHSSLLAAWWEGGGDGQKILARSCPDHQGGRHRCCSGPKSWMPALLPALCLHHRIPCGKASKPWRMPSEPAADPLLSSKGG